MEVKNVVSYETLEAEKKEAISNIITTGIVALSAVAATALGKMSGQTEIFSEFLLYSAAGLNFVNSVGRMTNYLADKEKRNEVEEMLGENLEGGKSL